MKLQTKVTIRFWLATAAIFVPTVVCLLFMLIFCKINRDYATGFMDIAQDLVEWRNDNVYWYTVNAKRGYSLQIK